MNATFVFNISMRTFDPITFIFVSQTRCSLHWRAIERCSTTSNNCDIGHFIVVCMVSRSHLFFINGAKERTPCLASLHSTLASSRSIFNSLATMDLRCRKSCECNRPSRAVGFAESCCNTIKTIQKDVSEWITEAFLYHSCCS